MMRVGKTKLQWIGWLSGCYCVPRWLLGILQLFLCNSNNNSDTKRRVRKLVFVTQKKNQHFLCVMVLVLWLSVLYFLDFWIVIHCCFDFEKWDWFLDSVCPRCIIWAHKFSPPWGYLLHVPSMLSLCFMFCLFPFTLSLCYTQCVLTSCPVTQLSK